MAGKGWCTSAPDLLSSLASPAPEDVTCRERLRRMEGSRDAPDAPGFFRARHQASEHTSSSGRHPPPVRRGPHRAGPARDEPGAGPGVGGVRRPRRMESSAGNRCSRPRSSAMGPWTACNIPTRPRAWRWSNRPHGAGSRSPRQLGAKANSGGGAQLSYPFVIPPGRGITPDLALDYDSGGGTGWVGLGWDLSVGDISVDTAFGAPHFDPTSRKRVVPPQRRHARAERRRRRRGSRAWPGTGRTTPASRRRSTSRSSATRSTKAVRTTTTGRSATRAATSSGTAAIPTPAAPTAALARPARRSTARPIVYDDDGNAVRGSCRPSATSASTRSATTTRPSRTPGRRAAGRRRHAARPAA